MIERLVRYLRMSGQCSSSELADFLSISISTVTRHLTKLIDDGSVVRLGQGKNIRYIALRSVVDIEQPVIIRQVNGHAQVNVLGKLWVINNGTILETDNAIIEYDDLPWFLFDLKPQGFIGRLIGRRVGKNLKVSAKVDSWSSDDILRYLVLEPNNTPGNIELFKDFTQVASVKRTKLTRPNILARYDKHVKMPVFTEFEENGGSSAGGEQPKFNSMIGGSKIVKYSPLLNAGNAAAERVKDLLICEHHALETLLAFNDFAAQSAIYITEDRLYLEIERFDRTSVGNKQGQLGMVSLESVIAEFVGYADNWAQASDSLLEQQILTNEHTDLLKLWLAYSRFIGNTDTHNGNVSLFLDGITPNRLTPAYDMLPMAYMPSNADIPTPQVRVLRPDNINDKIWHQGRALATNFWQRVTNDRRVSDEFKEVAILWIDYIEKDISS